MQEVRQAAPPPGIDPLLQVPPAGTCQLDCLGEPHMEGPGDSPSCGQASEAAGAEECWREGGDGAGVANGGGALLHPALLADDVGAAGTGDGGSGCSRGDGGSGDEATAGVPLTRLDEPWVQPESSEAAAAAAVAAAAAAAATDTAAAAAQQLGAAHGGWVGEDDGIGRGSGGSGAFDLNASVVVAAEQQQQEEQQQEEEQQQQQQQQEQAFMSGLEQQQDEGEGAAGATGGGGGGGGSVGGLGGGELFDLAARAEAQRRAFLATDDDEW